MQCELCGKESSHLKYVLIDGVKMLVCPECAKYGTPVDSTPQTSNTIIKRTTEVTRKPRDKEDLFKKMKKVLVNEWNKKIKDARIKKGLTREELGFRVGERTVAIAKMENGDLRPSDETAKKLEKELDIELFQELEEIDIHTQKSTKSGITLGDIIKMQQQGEHERD